MTARQELVDVVLGALSEQIEIMLLRGVDEERRPRGDIDFVVPFGRAVEGVRLVAEAAAKGGWSIIGFRDIGYMSQLCLFRPEPAGMEDVAVKIDVFNGLTWYALGHDLIGEAVFHHRHRSEGEAVALATFFQKMLYPGYLRDRDRMRIFSGIDAPSLESFCRRYRLPISPVEIEHGRLRKFSHWRLRVVSGGAAGARVVPWGVRAVWAALRFRSNLGTGGGQVIGVAGMDGSGKSTLVDRFCRALVASEFTEPMLVHLLPDVIPTPHRLVRRQKTVDNYTKPYAEPPVASRLNGMVRLGYYMAAFTAARLWCAAKVAQGRTVVFDRSILDFSSDLARARIPHMELPGRLITMLMPKGAFLYIEASPETVVARKGELTLERALKLAKRYDNTARTTGIHRLDGNSDAESVFAAFLETVTAEATRRIRGWQKR